MNLWNTTPSPTQAKAFLGVAGQNVVFSFNPDEVKWAYKNNTVSRDTIGGRVVQVLSSSVDAMTVTGRAGSRERLQVLARDLKNLMQYHIKTGESINFKVPSRNWNFKVYIQNVSSLGWDVTATSYPYQLTLMIEEDLGNLIAQKFKQDAFLNLAKGIGYNPEFHGGNGPEAMKYIEAMNNAINAIDFGSSGGGTGTTGVGTGKYKPKDSGRADGNRTKANELIALAGDAINSVPQVSAGPEITIREIYALAYWALGALGNLTGDALKEVAIKSTAISCCETQSHNIEAINPEATNGTAYGLWQMNDGLGSSLWDPIVAALRMAQSYYRTEWRYWSCGRDSNSRGYTKYIDQVRSEVA